MGMYMDAVRRFGMTAEMRETLENALAESRNEGSANAYARGVESRDGTLDYLIKNHDLPHMHAVSLEFIRHLKGQI